MIRMQVDEIVESIVKISGRYNPYTVFFRLGENVCHINPKCLCKYSWGHMEA